MSWQRGRSLCGRDTTGGSTFAEGGWPDLHDVTFGSMALPPAIFAGAASPTRRWRRRYAAG
jgi:hypothetical protein